MDLGSIVVRIGADTSQLDHAVDRASKALQSVEKAVQSANTATQKLDTVTSQAAKQMNDLEKAADKTAKAVQGVGQTYEKVARGGQIIEISSDQLRHQLEILQAQRRAREEMGIYEDATYRSTSKIGLWWASVAESVQNSIAKIGKGWDGFAKGLDTISKGLRKTGRELTKYLTAPLMLVGGLAFNAALKVDDAMDFIAASTGATGAQLASLQDSFRNLGRTSASDLMDVGAVTADLYRKFGLEGQALESVGTKVLDLARLTHENAGQMEQAWSQMVRNWNVDATQYESTLDKLMMVHQKTGIGVGELSNAMVYLGPLLRGMGYNWDQAAAFIGNFYKAGVDTGNLMFGIRNAVNEFAELSLDPKTTLMAYVRAIEQAKTESEALAVAHQIFGQRAGPLFADAIRRGAIQIDELVAQLAGAEGAIAKANEQTWGWQQSWAQFKNKAQFALEPLGNTLVKIAEDNLPGIANSLDGILKTFSSWPVSTQESVVKGLVLLAGLGPGLSAVAGALTAVKTIVAALSTSLGAAAIGFVLAGAGITMLVNKMRSTEEQLKAAPAFKFSELDKVTQGQFATAADILRSKEPDRAKQVAGMLGISTDQLVTAGVVDKDSKLLMTDQTQLLDTLVALWQGKTQTMADAMAQTAGTSGLAISEEMAEGLLAGSPEFMKALEKMLKDADAYLPHSNAKKGPFSRLTQSGAGFVNAWAAGVLSNNAAVDAVSHTFAQVARLMPHSDAERGPLADITGSGKAFSQTFAKGILAEADVVSKATERLGRLLIGRTESLNTRYVHNLRVLRDSTDNLWWQTASIPGAAMRFAADVALDGAANATSAATNLTDSLSQWAQAYAIDAEAVAKAQEATQKELTNTLTAWAEFYALDAAAYDEWVKGKNLEDMLVEWSAFYALDLAAMEAYAAEKAAIQKRLVEDLSAWASFYALDMEQAAEQGAQGALSKWERLKDGLAALGVDMKAVQTTALTALQSEAQKSFVNIVTGFGVTAEDALAIWKKFGIDVTKENSMTFKSMEQVVEDFRKNTGAVITTLFSDITTKLITGQGDWKSIFAKAMSSMLTILINTAIQAVLTAEVVQKALKWMWSPLGGIIIAGALVTLAAIQAAISKATTPEGDVQALAAGGIVTKPTMALIGEAGPEAVVPLSRGRGMGGGVTVVVNVTGNTIMGDRDADALGRRVAQSITDQLRQAGVRPAFSY